MAPPNPPPFRLPSEPVPPAPSFSPPSGNVPSNGLFSATSTPQQPHRSSTTPATLFAGATPGLKFNQNSNGIGLYGDSDSPDDTLKFSLAESTKPISRKSSTLLSDRTGRESRMGGKYMSPTDGDDEDETKIFEDNQDEDTHQEYDDDDMEDETGVFDDDDEEDEVDESYDLLQSKHNNDSRRVLLGMDDTIKTGIVSEPGSLIIRTEELMRDLARTMAPKPVPDYDSEAEDDDIDMESDRPVPPPPEKLEEFLTKYSKAFLETLASHLPKADPKSRLHKAYYITSLLLPLNHSCANVPETLRKWLYTHDQNPSRQQLQSLKAFHPNCVFSQDYWDILHRLILRGEVQEAIDLMSSTNWDKICVDAPVSKALKFNPNTNQTLPVIEKRYPRPEIDSIKIATDTCIRLLSQCPGLARSSYAPSSIVFFPQTATQHGTPADWRIWQGMVFAACEELRGRNSDAEDSMLDETDDSYYDLHPRNGHGSFGLGVGEKNKEKAQLPQNVARRFREIYEIMRGDRDTIMSGNDKWEDSVVGLMFWNVAGATSTGSYDDDTIEEESDSEENTNHDGKVIDRTRREKELVRLRKTTESLVEELPIDPTSELDLAIGGIMVGDPNAVGEILPKFSLLAASAAVEISGWAGLIKRNPINESAAEATRRWGGMMDVFDEDDNAVFGSIGRAAGTEGDMADGVLKEYAAGLFGLEWVDEEAEFEGWEAGVGVLERIKGGKELAGNLLTQLELGSKARVEKLLTYCNENNLSEEASDIAASFASHLITSTTSYGDSLHFYSLSPYHRPAIHTLLTKLLSSSLLLSTAIPPTQSLDATLARLLSSPTSSDSLILRFELSGYATLRHFYALRDSSNPTPAVKALVATIRSAGEKLDGGVLDPEWECAVEEWMLGALLGELIPFLGRTVRCIGIRECMDVMKVLTDFELVGGESMRRADEFLKRVMAAKHSPPCHGTIKGSVMGASMLSSWEDVKRGIDEGTILDRELSENDVDREWDWRDGFLGSGERKFGVKEVIGIVRLRLSREVARAWLEGED